MTFQPQFLKDNNGNNIGVFMPFKDYEMLLEQLEELENIKDFDVAIQKNEKTIELREAIRLRKQKNG